MLAEVNLAYNVLLNEHKPDNMDPSPWARYIPETFKTIALPTDLEKIRKALVSTVPQGDWWDKTYRVEALLSLLGRARWKHITEVFPIRETNRLIEPVDYPFGSLVNSVNPEASAAPSAALILDKTVSIDVPVRRRWRIAFLGGTSFSITYLNNNATSTKTLIDTKLQVDKDIRFTVNTSELVSGALWDIISVTQPTNTLVNSYAAVKQVRSEVDRLFTKDTLLASDLKIIKDKTIFNDDFLFSVLFMYIIRSAELI